jgi:hypothetical protein
MMLTFVIFVDTVIMIILVYNNSFERQQESVASLSTSDLWSSRNESPTSESRQSRMLSLVVSFYFILFKRNVMQISNLVGKNLPTELRKSAVEMQKDLAFDAAQEDPMTSVDYEYARAGIRDPKLVITTSRDPSSKLLQFAKVCLNDDHPYIHLDSWKQEMRLVFPNSHRINRGNYVIKELAEACRANEVTDLIVLHETRGVPGTFTKSTMPHTSPADVPCRRPHSLAFSPWPNGLLHATFCDSKTRSTKYKHQHSQRTVPSSHI